jgi:sugar phosphate isomerase/epimerase
VKLGVLTVVHGDLSLEQSLDRLVALGVDAVELGCGGYPGTAHCDPSLLLADPARARALRRAVDERGLMISALSCHGNPLHPDPSQARDAHEAWVRAAQLAEVLEVDVVCTFSGCPGDESGGRCPNWITCAWPPEFADTLRWQWDACAIPYWQAQNDLAARHGVRIALEMHPGFLVYNPETLLALRSAAGPQVGANLDPSHLFWQGIEPVAALRELADDHAVFHVHAKDTFIDRDVVARHGVLDAKPYARVRERAWTFRTVGFGHSEAEWRAILSALRVAGYDDVISIEHEDMLLSRDEGLARAVEFLRRTIPVEPAPEAWWT